jgi:hypothetical protein
MKSLPMPACIGLCTLLMFLAHPGYAHDPFESTVIARLQHGRLELVVTMTTQLASLLAGDQGNPETPELNSGNLEDYRERLAERAKNLYEVTAGGAVLTSQRAVVSLTANGHVELVVVYPQPSAWPLRFRAHTFDKLPASYTASLDVFDRDEKLLGRKTIGARNVDGAELSVQPALPEVPPEPAPAKIVPARSPVTESALHGPWMGIGISVVLCVAALGLIICFGQKSTGGVLRP